jgi:hypothetical protein
MMSDGRRPHHYSAISPFSPKTAPLSLVVETTRRGIFFARGDVSAAFNIERAIRRRLAADSGSGQVAFGSQNQ